MPTSRAAVLASGVADAALVPLVERSHAALSGSSGALRFPCVRHGGA